MRYDVELTQKYTETVNVVVEADSKEEAKKKAVEYAQKHPMPPSRIPEYTPGMAIAKV